MRLGERRRAPSAWRSAIERPSRPWRTISPVAIGCGRSWYTATSDDGSASSARSSTTRGRAVRISLGRRATLRLRIVVGIGGSIALIIAIIVVAVVGLILIVILVVLLR